MWERHRLEVGAEDAGDGRVNANAASGLQAAPCPEAMVDASLAIDMRAGMVSECALLNQLLDVMKLAVGHVRRRFGSARFIWVTSSGSHVQDGCSM